MDKNKEREESESVIKGSSLKYKKPTPEEERKFDIFLGLEEDSPEEEEK